MGGKSLQGGVAAALGARPQGVADAWLERYAESPLRLPGAFERSALGARIQPLIAALARALGTAPDAAAEPLPGPGSRALREVEQQFGFAAAQLAAEGKSGFDAAALVAALRHALVAEAADTAEREAIAELADWLSAIMFEAFAAGARNASQERARDLLEERGAVVCVAPDVPAALPLGNRELNGFESALARLALLVVRVGARSVIIDASGLVAPDDPGCLSALAQFCSHPKVAGAIAIVATGLTSTELERWRAAAAGVEIRAADSFLAAVEIALQRSEHRLVRRGA